MWNLLGKFAACNVASISLTCICRLSCLVTRQLTTYTSQNGLTVTPEAFGSLTASSTDWFAERSLSLGVVGGGGGAVAHILNRLIAVLGASALLTLHHIHRAR